MVAQTKNVKIHPVRFSYVHVWEKSETLAGDMKYSVSVIIPKDHPELPKIKAAIKQAAVNKFGEDRKKWPKKLWNPLQDGDKTREEPAYENCYYLSPKTDGVVGVVGPDAKPILDQDEFYSGCYGVVSVSFFGFNKAGKRGVGVGLNNVMKLKEGERLDGVVSAEEDFADYKTDEITEDNEEISSGPTDQKTEEVYDDSFLDDDDI